jgi:hypothetical protein
VRPHQPFWLHLLVLIYSHRKIIIYLQQSPNFDPLHVYPVLPPHVASGEIFKVGVEEALLDVRVIKVVSVFDRVEAELDTFVEPELDEGWTELELDEELDGTWAELELDDKLDCKVILLEPLEIEDESTMDGETALLEALVLAEAKVLP